ncbi:hypothetical protein GCM10007160_16160 [Litchfieldella qijiaojingensis]|uniref:Uncharacterized protein n=1 Tax=Litchfieldella qijiaojingensis TaxID=980347 RepID=A0ABQ2YQM3_9GAMM|nr:hypothetical protein [Halomonas qijiaojingensis]GGX89564.1 hypothetical protein GCM10007160_16160 [Halomonas qijiaojingensis]
MPYDQQDVAKLILMPEELLVLADTHETHEMHHYRRLAFSFLPFDVGISKLMAALGVECERRLDTQREVTQELGLSDLITTGEAGNAARSPFGKHYFFIVNRAMAMAMLTQVIASADYSLRFHEHLQSANAMPELDPMLKGFVKQKQAECRILQESLDSLESSVDSVSMPAMASYRQRSLW